jgi:hypothetical protein
MNENRKIAIVGKIVSFAEAEEHEVEYYAQLSWKESAGIVEEMRQSIWNKEYLLPRSRQASITHLKDDRDDFE